MKRRFKVKNETILVIGASGTVGSELVRILRSTGHTVRTTTSKQPQDASAVQINVATGEGIKAAFQGVDRAFLLSPPGYADQYAMLSPLIQEAKRQGLKKVVLMTAMGANAVETSPFRRAEMELEKSGLTYNIVRPNWFFQNFNTFWAQGIREQNGIFLPAGEAATSFVDTQDVSAVMARLLTSSEFDNQAFDLTGPQALTHQEVADAISSVTPKKIVYQDIPPEILKKGLLSAGLPPDYVDFMLLIFGFLHDGYNSRTTASVKTILGREPRSVKEYVKRHQQSWL